MHSSIGERYYICAYKSSEFAFISKFLWYVTCINQQISKFFKQIVLFKYIYSPSFGWKLSYQSVVDSIYAQSYLVQEILDLRDIIFSEFTQD